MAALDSEQLGSAIRMLDLAPVVAGIASSSIVKLTPNGKGLKISISSSLAGEAIIGIDDSFEKEYFVDRSLFFPFVLTDARKRPYKVSDEGKVLIFRHGNRRVELKANTPVSGYIKSLDAKAELAISKKQRAAIKLASKYAVRDPSIQQLNCVHMQSERGIYASNEFAVFCYPDKSLNKTVTLPFPVADLVDHSELKSIKIGEKGCCMFYPVGQLSVPGLAKSRESFPVTAAIKRFKQALDYPLLFQVSAKDLFKSVKRFQSYAAVTMGRQELVLQFNGKKGSDFVSITFVAPQGTFVEKVRIINPVTSEFACEWLYDLVAPLTDISTDNPVKIYSEKETPVLLKVGPYKILLPRKDK